MEYYIYDSEHKGFVESVGREGIFYTADLDKAFSFPNIRVARDVFDNLVEEGWMLATHEYKWKTKGPVDPKGEKECLQHLKIQRERTLSRIRSTVSSGTKRTRQEPRYM